MLDGHAKGVWCVTFSPDGQTLAAPAATASSSCGISATGQVRLQLIGHTSEVYGLAFSPNGAAWSAAAETRPLNYGTRPKVVNCAACWDIAARSAPVAFAPNGRTVASGSQDNTVRLWRVADGLELATFKLPGSFCRGLLSRWPHPGGRRLVQDRPALGIARRRTFPLKIFCIFLKRTGQPKA